MDISLLLVNCKSDIIIIDRTLCNYMTSIATCSYSDMKQPCILLPVHS